METPAVVEVEVKFHLGCIRQAEESLQAAGLIFDEGVEHEDQSYAPVTWMYGDPKCGVPFARIRRQGDRVTLTVKTPISSVRECVESELDIDDVEKAHNMLVQLGFKPTTFMKKRRRTAYRDDTTFTLDEVPALGSFLEVERIVSDPSVDRSLLLDHLTQVVRDVGVEGSLCDDTYDSLLQAVR